MKKFISKFREYTIFINVNGRHTALRFHDMGKFLNQSVFVTNDDLVYHALIRDSRFNRDYYLEGAQPGEEEEIVEERKYDKEFPYIKRTQAAIELLVKDYDVKRSDIKVKADVLAKADELNISFPNL